MNDPADVPDDVRKLVWGVVGDYWGSNPKVSANWAEINIAARAIMLDRASRPNTSSEHVKDTPGSERGDAREAVLGKVDQIVCEEWQAFARVPEALVEEMVDAIRDRIRALSTPTAASPAVEPVAWGVLCANGEWEVATIKEAAEMVRDQEGGTIFPLGVLPINSGEKDRG